MGRSSRGDPCARCAAAPPRPDPAPGGAVYQAMLTLAAIMLWVLLFVTFAAVGGCSQGVHHRCRGHGALPAEATRASLIFAAEPDLTPLPAEAITRADWPTTSGRTSGGETINYQEYWYDAQGLGPFDYDYGYRTFTQWRSGQQSQ